MKKFCIVGMSFLILIAISLPVSAAVENIFGGYWRTRAFSQTDFTGDNSEDWDYQVVDTRTRLYYTAKFSDNLKLVNKFEMDAVWGDNTKNAGGDNGYGDIGADGVRVEVKNSYVDFNLGDNFNAKVGVQDFTFAKGYLFDDDASGVKLAYNAGIVDIPIYWFRYNEGGIGKDANDADEDFVMFSPIVKVRDGITINPFIGYKWCENYESITALGSVAYKTDWAHRWKKESIYTFGIDINANMGPASFGVIGIYTKEKLSDPTDPTEESIYPKATDDFDQDGYLLEAFGSMDFGPVNAHAEIIYATGDDSDKEYESNAYPYLAGASHYWAEIMGLGIFDNWASNGSPADAITNLLAFNLGASTKVMDKVKLSLDVWYAQLAEDNENGDKELGTEIDFMATIPIIDKLDLDLVAAYLFAGDATGTEDPIEIGAQLSLAF
jgi:hypothetical protein